MKIELEKIKKTIPMVLIIIVFLGIIWGSVTFYKSKTSKFGTLTITTASQTINYKINGKKYSGPIDNETVKTGDYKINFSDSLFLDKEIEFNIKENENTNISVFLDPLNVKSMSTENQVTVESILNKNGDISAENLVRNYPLLLDLPYVASNFMINFSYPKNVAKPILFVTLFSGSNNFSVPQKDFENWIKLKKTNLEDFEINYDKKVQTSLYQVE